MSFSDPGFLFSSRLTDNEREAERRAWEQRREEALRAYRRASWLVAVTMLFIALPTGLEKWHWHAVGVAGICILALAVVMFLRGAVKNGLLALLFAAVILPMWVKTSATVVTVACEQVQVIMNEWKKRVF